MSIPSYLQPFPLLLTTQLYVHSHFFFFCKLMCPVPYPQHLQVSLLPMDFSCPLLEFHVLLPELGVLLLELVFLNLHLCLQPGIND